MSVGSRWAGFWDDSDFVKSEARMRNNAVRVKEEIGVVDTRCAERNCVSHAWDTGSDLELRWSVICDCAAVPDIFLSMIIL